jgi:modulator of FtsH protease
MSDNIQVLSRDASANVAQNRVLRNTYALLGLSLIPTAIGAMLGIAVMFVLFQAIAANQNRALGIWLLLGMTFLFGLMLGPILQVAFALRNGAEIVGLAAGGTALTFLSLAAIGSSPARDFSGLGKFLFVGLILAVIASLVNMFLHIPVMSLAISGISVLIFSGYILYDVNQIVRGGQTNYVMATLALYLDIYNLFVNLLYLLMSIMGNNRE